jgi:hypothetical protein
MIGSDVKGKRNSMHPWASEPQLMDDWDGAGIPTGLNHLQSSLGISADAL